MTKNKSVGIKGIGIYLPDTVRTNEDWPEEVVATWRERLAKIVPTRPAAEGGMSEGVRLTLEALEAVRADPFQGGKARRVMGRDQTATELASKAALEALSKAHVQPGEIDLILTHAMLPDYMCVNGAAMLQDLLGLPPGSMAFPVDAVCASAIAELELAKALILTGQSKLALLTQVANTSSLAPMSEPFSAVPGDAAAALVVGPVEEGLGLLSSAYRTDGSLHGGFVASIPGKRWFDDGRLTVCNIDRAAAKRMQLEAPDGAKVVVDEALEKAGIAKREVTLFACHEPTSWFARVCQEVSGLQHAQRFSSFAWTGTINSVCIPMQLALAQREGCLRKGDVVVTFTPSSGQMLCASVMRWAY